MQNTIDNWRLQIDNDDKNKAFIFTSIHEAFASAPVFSPSILDKNTSRVRDADFQKARMVPKLSFRSPENHSSMAR